MYILVGCQLVGNFNNGITLQWAIDLQGISDYTFPVAFNTTNFVSFWGTSQNPEWDYAVQHYYQSKTESNVSMICCWFPNTARWSQGMGHYNWVFIGF